MKKYFIPLVAIVAVLSLGFFGGAHAQTVGVTLPSVPTGVNVTSPAPLQIYVTWSGSTESSGTIEGYYVYRNGVQIATTAGGSFTDAAGLTAGLYDYSVAAYDANGVISAQSSPVSITLTVDKTPPSVPTGVTVTGASTTNSYYKPTVLTISWTASTDNVGVAGYRVYRNNVQIGSSTSALTGTSITDTVTPGTYAYTVVAYDAAQNFSNASTPVSVTVAIDSNAPSIPTNISLQQTAATTINVSWASSTDNYGVAGYQVFRDLVQIATTTGASYSDNGVLSGSSYSYTVTAFDAAGNTSIQSAPSSLMVQQLNGIRTPYALSLAVVSPYTVRVSWAPAIDAIALTGYEVYRDGTQIATVTSTSYLDTNLASGTYNYGVTASDVSGAVSAMSATSSITVTPPAVAPASVPTTVTVTVTPPSISTSAPTTPSTVGTTFTQSLYYGLRNAQVSALQSLLVEQGDLAPIDATGFFGNLTLSAIEKLQCAQNIVCTGGAGWGIVGPKTRAALNVLEGTSAGASVTANTTGSASTPSVTNNTAVQTQIQALEAQLATLESQLSAQQ